MFRFTIIPFIFLFGGLFFSIFLYFVYRKLKRGVAFTYKKSAELSSEYLDKWRNQEQRKKLPKIVQMGFENYQAIERSIDTLPPVWQLKLIPLKQKSSHLLNDITQKLTEDESFERNGLNSVRSFFNHSLDALKQLTQKLETDHTSLTYADNERVRENIKLIYDDLLRHEKRLHKSRKFDFDVLMDVIKARVQK